MTLRLDDEDAAKLRPVAQHEGRPMHEVVLTALHGYLSKRDEFRARQVNRFLGEDADLLDLLSK